VCTKLSATTAQCSGQSVGNIGANEVFLGGGNDHFLLHTTHLKLGGLLRGGSDNDILSGPAPPVGAGHRQPHGRDGDDTLIGREDPRETAVKDTLSCGTGSDTAIIDLLDTSLGCETGDRSNRRARDPPDPDPRDARQRRGAEVRLHCPRSSKTRCRGRLTLTKRGARLGSSRYNIPKGDG
jgi:hypothetical protein